MTLREDPESYCLLWLGMMFLAPYYVHAIHILPAAATLLPVTIFGVVAQSLLLGPPLMIIFLFGYLKPRRGRMKQISLSLAVATGALYTIVLGLIPVGLTGGLMLPFWGTGASILVAGAASIYPSSSESSMEPLLDTHALRYPPEESGTPEGDS
ncbi:MAG: hypothetical protein QXQ81_08215 [Candidatus Thorarchaeota archaeon]